MNLDGKDASALGIPRIWSSIQDPTRFHHPLAKVELGLLDCVPFDDTELLRHSVTSLSHVILGDGGHLLPSSWGRDGIELVTFFIGYVRVFIV